MPKAKFVFDTNALVSGILLKSSNNVNAFDKAREAGVVVTSKALNKEIVDVFLRKKFDKYLILEKRLELLSLLLVELVLWPVTPEIKIEACRDAKDNMILELAVAAKASAIVTGDPDLLVLHPFRGIPIVNAADFMSMSF